MQSAAVGFAPDDTLWVTVATSAIAVLPGASAMSPGALQTDGGLVEPGLLAATGVLVGVRGGAYPGEHVNLLGPGKAAERYPSASGQPNTFLAADLGEAVAFAVRGAQGAAEIVSFPFSGGAATTLASGLAYRLAPRAPGAWARRALLVETPDDALWHRAEVGPDGLVIDPEGHVWGRGDALPGAWVLESGDGDDAVYRLCPLALDLPCGGGRAEVRALDAVVVDADGHPAAIARAGDGRRHLLRTWLVAP
ncbi:MAG: hypothetical protein U1F43_17090 [Myxococcota bacterium]